ncbi:uncharacterized protein LACBIDRAFT_295998 [Laccaria bicolor S238N-H82]|uniref:Predicted protein n=1 Tax=Laccaria bicolor (strain S238N-H82 / ATCC MYA-4686) TaxID=486041 RepID=B0E1L5_LACBS|nr:uncharacterized protein LACBIDRAFT_295998 [Laccaria bicolor S238N-H82]EDQ99285.1 predicted protein [Laccaria bicolor S238N-H82]|eukprot:XP_001890095.1 predicted protein [Laccaria bicolor S238N-H82]
MVDLAWMSNPITPMSSDGSHTKIGLQFYDSSLGASPSNAPLMAHSLFSRQNIPSCAGECIASADLGGCATTDNACLCKSKVFVSSTAACIERTCTGSDLATAIAAAEAICAAAGVTLSDLPTVSATATGPSSPTATSVASSSSTSSGGSGTVMIAPIVGGVVGFLALVAFIVVGLIWFRKSRRKRRVWVRRSQSLTSVEHSPILPSSTIEPFPIPSAAPQNSGQLQSSNKSASPGGPLAPPSTKQLVATGLIPTTTQTPSLTQMSSSSASTPIGGSYSHGIVGNTSRVLLHQDSGIRLPRQAGENEVVEMPPLKGVCSQCSVAVKRRDPGSVRANTTSGIRDNVQICPERGYSLQIYNSFKKLHEIQQYLQGSSI